MDGLAVFDFDGGESGESDLPLPLVPQNGFDPTTGAQKSKWSLIQLTRALLDKKKKTRF